MRMGKSLTGRGLGEEDEGITFDEDDVVTGTPLWRDNPFTDSSAAGTPDPVKTLSVSGGARSIRNIGPLYRVGQTPIPGTNAPGVGVMDMLPLLAVVGGGILAVLFLMKK